jgi:hypothetical protein
MENSNESAACASGAGFASDIRPAGRELAVLAKEFRHFASGRCAAISTARPGKQALMQ